MRKKAGYPAFFCEFFGGDMKKAVEHIKARLKEPSTWAALAGVCASFGWGAGVAICGALGVLIGEGGRSE